MQRTLILAAIAVATRLPAQTITEYRWWLNDDVSTLVTTGLTSAPDLTLNSTLDLPLLDRDYNIITVQFKDSNGEWSSPHTRFFSRATGAVTGYEYWIDDAIADRVSNSIGPAGVVDLIADLPTSTTAGEHLFTIRFSSENGAWSVPLSSTFSFTVGVDELPGVSDLLLFPNPATDQLGLRLNSTEARTLRLDVLDVSGQQVLELGQWSVTGTSWNNWDISGLARGTYLLCITGEQGAWTTRFVKQ